MMHGLATLVSWKLPEISQRIDMPQPLAAGKLLTFVYEFSSVWDMQERYYFEQIRIIS